MNKKPLTKKQAEEFLNEMEIPFDNRKSNGGLIPDNCKYGSWLRRNDPIAFHYCLKDLQEAGY